MQDYAIESRMVGYLRIKKFNHLLLALLPKSALKLES